MRMLKGKMYVKQLYTRYISMDVLFHWFSEDFLKIFSLVYCSYFLIISVLSLTIFCLDLQSCANYF